MEAGESPARGHTYLTPPRGGQPRSAAPPVPVVLPRPSGRDTTTWAGKLFLHTGLSQVMRCPSREQTWSVVGTDQIQISHAMKVYTVNEDHRFHVIKRHVRSGETIFPRQQPRSRQRASILTRELAPHTPPSRRCRCALIAAPLLKVLPGWWEQLASWPLPRLRRPASRSSSSPGRRSGQHSAAGRRLSDCPPAEVGGGGRAACFLRPRTTLLRTAFV